VRLSNFISKVLNKNTDKTAEPVIERKLPIRKIGDGIPGKRLLIIDALYDPFRSQISFARDGKIVWTGTIDSACTALTQMEAV
jgi:hypothetical protein